MITLNKLILRTFGQSVVLVMLFTSIVTLTQKEASAVPLEPVIEQVGSRVVERILENDSTQAVSSQDQEQEDEDDIEQTDATLDPTEETAPTPVNSTQEQPTLEQAASQPTCPPAFPQPIGQPTYPPAFPQPYPPNPQLPMNVTPVYAVPQAYPPMMNYSPTPVNRTPVIINNF